MIKKTKKNSIWLQDLLTLGYKDLTSIVVIIESDVRGVSTLMSKWAMFIVWSVSRAARRWDRYLTTTPSVRSLSSRIRSIS